MVGAAITHLRRREYPNIVVNLVLLALALFVAGERLGPQSF
jgi:DoxX-like family